MFVPVLKTLLVVRMSLGCDKHQGVLLPGRNGSSPGVIYKTSDFLLFFASPLLITCPLSCSRGDGVSATEQYLSLKSVLR